MTEAGSATSIHAAALSGKAARLRRRGSWAVRGRLYFVLMLLMLPTLGGMILFTYVPKFSAIRFAFYEWDGQQTQEFRGWGNFVEAFTRDPIFWQTFHLVLILLIANALKMWPSIFTAVAIHRLRSERWQYIYRVLFVIPMVIPGLVTLLIWKSFFEPSLGVLNIFLNATGLMSVLQWLDVRLPQLAQALLPVRNVIVDAPFGGGWALMTLGVMCFSASRGLRGVAARPVWWLILIMIWAVTWKLSGGATAWLWVWPAVVLALCEGHRRMRVFNEDAPKYAGITLAIIALLTLLLTEVWTTPTRAFDTGSPAWLGHTKLIIPSIILWGFPWVGTVGVLIYLAGLQSISHDVYEAAEIDGVGSIGRLFRIELPLILTQVRINLIFMTIGTLTDYGLFLLLLGPNGGPGNVGMVPGLYMYRTAFIDGRFGYACALGMVLFVILLVITILYQRYVRVEK